MIRRRIRSKLQKVLLHDKSGMTLVELMVTFLLLVQLLMTPRLRNFQK